MIFTSAHKNRKGVRRSPDGGSHPAAKGVRIWAVAFWLLLWQLGATALSQQLLLVLLPSPVEVLSCLARLAVTAGFWCSVGWSAARILSGFMLALVGGTVLAGLSMRFRAVRALLAPLVTAVKAVPVVSFIILLLVWLPSRQLSLFISALMVFPTVYLNLLEGVDHTDRGLLEMARVFRVPLGRRLRDIYLPQVLPWLRSACSLGLGLCWKSGVAAEVIGLPGGSVGEQLYTAKIYMEMPELFAWTVTIVAVSAVFEKLVLWLLDRFGAKGAKP